MDEYYSKYGLYVYSEGKFATKARNMRLDGIPVLFIPGNGGSYKQVRSLSSVALRMALNSRSPYHFDYFTVNLNSELSGLYGPLLYHQLEYVNSSLNRIIELYNKENKPKSIIVIGHSMGGVVAKKLISEHGTNLISVLITLAAPLKRPLLFFDYHMFSFYNNYQSNENSSVIVSLSGGYSDFLIPSYLSYIEGPKSLHIMTTNIPRCWIEVNHVQIVWCKQIVLAINRALFDCIDLESQQLSRNVTYLKKVFIHHLIQHSGINPQQFENYTEIVKLNHKGQWIESLLRQYSIEFLYGLRQPYWYMVKLTPLFTHEMLTVLGVNVETVNWIYACNAHLPKGRSKVCTEAKHLTHLSGMVPSLMFKRRYLELNMHQLKEQNADLTHVVINVLPTSEPVVLHIDIYNMAERTVFVDLPNWWKLKKSLILYKTAEKAVYYKLVLPNLQHILQFYQLYVEPFKCSSDIHHASATLIVPWGNQDQHAYFTNMKKEPLNIRLYTSKPQLESNSAAVRLILEPSCLYQISIKSSLSGLLSQIVRVGTPSLLTNIAAVILLTLRSQLINLKNDRHLTYFAALSHGMRLYCLYPLIIILLALLGELHVDVDLPKMGIFYLLQDGIDFVVLSIFSFLCSIGIVLLIAVIYSLSLITLDSTINKLLSKLLKHVTFLPITSNWLYSILQKLPFVAAGLSIFICISACGSLALCTGALFYYIKITNMSQNYIEEEIWNIIKRFAIKCKVYVTKKEYKTVCKRNIQTVSGIIKQNSNDKVNGNNCGSEEDEPVEQDVDKNKYEAKIIENIQLDSRHVTSYKDKDIIDLYNSITFHSSLFFIWCIITIINIPATLTWANNFRFNKALMPDDSFIPGLVLSFCALPLWQFELPKPYRKWTTQLEIFITLSAVSILIFATISIFILNYLLTLVIAIVTLHQLFAPRIKCDGPNYIDALEDLAKGEKEKVKLN